MTIVIARTGAGHVVNRSVALVEEVVASSSRT